MAQFIGLDIGSNTIKVVELSGGKGGLQLLNFGLADTPPDAVSGGVITDPAAVGQAIRQLLTVNGIKTRKVISSVAGQTSLVVRIIEVPRMAPSELKETMKWEVERHVPFATTDVIMDYAPIERPDSDPNSPNMEVLFAVAQQETIEAHVQALQAAGLEPQAIDIEPLALGRALIDLAGNGGQGETIAIVNIGAATTELCIVKDGLLHFPRTIPVAGDALTKAISEGLGVSETQAEEIKREHATILRETYVAPEPVSEERPGGEGVRLGTLSIPGETLDQAEEPFSLGETAAPEEKEEFSLADTAVQEEPAAFDLSDTSATTDEGVPVFDLSETTTAEEEEEAKAPFVFDLEETPSPETPAEETAGLSFDLEEEAIVEQPSTPEEVPTFTLDLGEPTEEGEEESPAVVSFAPPEEEEVPGPVFDLGEEESPTAPSEVERPPLDLSEEVEEAPTPYVEEETEAPRFDLEEEAGVVPFTPGEETEEAEEAAVVIPGLDLARPLEIEEPPAEEAAPSAKEGEVSIQRQVYDAMLPVLAEIVTEIRRSLEYYRNRHEDATIDRLV
ncbi:MAG TPA: type IV pilus assembly protein PilM, partial [Armatimonadetes bacterium]|nr:type IV pilus assembly protein PilM [Armatimonadota bacterium]